MGKIDTFNERLIDYIKTITLGVSDAELEKYINYLEFIREEIDVVIDAEFQQEKEGTNS